MKSDENNTAIQMLFIGYDDESKAFRCYDTLNRKLVISRDVRFVRNQTHSEEVLIDLSTKQGENPSIDDDVDQDSFIDSDNASFESANSSYKESSSSSDSSEAHEETLTGDQFNYRDTDSSSDSETTSSSGTSESTVVPGDFETSLDEEYGELSQSMS